MELLHHLGSIAILSENEMLMNVSDSALGFLLFRYRFFDTLNLTHEEHSGFRREHLWEGMCRGLGGLQQESTSAPPNHRASARTLWFIRGIHMPG